MINYLPLLAHHRRIIAATTKRCTLSIGAEHTTKLAGDLSDNEVFSRPNTSVLGLGAVNRKATGTANFVCSNPVPPYGLNSHSAGFQSQLGAKAKVDPRVKTILNSV